MSIHNETNSAIAIEKIYEKTQFLTLKQAKKEELLTLKLTLKAQFITLKQAKKEAEEAELLTP